MIDLNPYIAPGSKPTSFQNPTSQTV